MLLVDVDRGMLETLERVLAFRARVERSEDFLGARARLVAHAPDLLVTRLRLGEYNGLHLAHLAAALELPTRVVVYDEADDLSLARETQIAGAFYVPRHHVAAALSAYIGAKLPPEDRRDVARPDRRQLSRGGRRATDVDARPAS